MPQSVVSEGMPWAGRILSEATGDRGSTLLGEISNYLDLSEVVTFVEQMSSEESDDLWSELDSLAGYKLPA